MIRSDLVQKLMALPALKDESDLEEAFKQYQDRHWVVVEGWTSGRCWRLILFGFSFTDRFRVSAEANECFQKMKTSFEKHADALQRQIIRAKDLRDATVYVQHDHDQLLEVIQYLALSGMPWHLSQRWNLLSLPRIRERVQEMNLEDMRWIPTLFSWFGLLFQLDELSDRDWIKFELFCWRNQALRGVAWMDFLEDWAKDDPKKTTLLKNLKEIFLFTRCRHLFRERTELLQAPPSPLLKISSQPIKLKAQEPVLQMIRMEDHAPVPLPPRLFTRLGPDRKEIVLTKQESLKHYLIQRTLTDLARYRLRVPKAQQADLERLLYAVPQQREHDAQIHRNCFSLLELADRLEVLLNKKTDEGIPQALRIASSLFPEERQVGLYPPGTEKGLYLFVETAIYFSLFHARIKIADESWQDLLFSLIGTCSPEEKSHLLQQLQTLPSRDEAVASTTPEILHALDEAQLFPPFRLATIFLQLLAKEEHPSFLTNKEILRLWKKMEEFLGPLQNPDLIVNLFCGPPIPKQVLTSLENFKPSSDPKALFLPMRYLADQDNLVKELARGLVASQPCRRGLVESLALATLQEDPAYVLTLLQFKGFQTPSEEMLGTVMPLTKELKLPSAGERHLHCLSTWRYRTVGPLRNSKTFATFECTLIFLDYLRAISFAVDLPDFLPVELFQEQYSAQLVSLFRNLILALTPERYLEEQEEHLTLILVSDTPEHLRDKIIAALEKLHWVDPLREFTHYVNPKPDQTDPERLRNAIALVQFVCQVKWAIRQALSPLSEGYNRMIAMPYNQGWQFFSRHQRGFSAGGLNRSDCQPIVDQIYRMQQGRTAALKFSVNMGDADKEIQVQVTSTELRLSTPHIRLDIKASLEGKGEISDNMQWPLTFPEAKAKELIFLLLCKVAWHA